MNITNEINGDRLESILIRVADYFQIPLVELKGTSRKYIYSHPRAVFCIVASSFGYPLVTIAQKICRDHSTVSYHIDNYREGCMLDHVKNDVQQLIQQINGTNN